MILFRDLGLHMSAFAAPPPPPFRYTAPIGEETMPRPTITFKSRAPRPEKTLYRQGDVLNVGVGSNPTFEIEVWQGSVVRLFTKDDLHDRETTFSKEGLRALGQALIDVADNL